VSPIITPHKKNSDAIRLCVDMRNANKAITHERLLIPEMFLAPGMPLITLRITFWKISEAEDIQKLRRLYRNKQ
jgi:hypothetical protein